VAAFDVLLEDALALERALLETSVRGAERRG
jgi:hypothetical protein